MPVVDLLKYDSYGKTSIVNDWVGLRYLWANTLGGSKFRLIGVCGLFAPGWRLCRHKDRFVLWCVACIVPPIVFFGGGSLYVLTDVFSLGLITGMGSGCLRNAVPYGWLLVCDEKTTRTDSFLRFRFCQTSTFISDLWRCPGYRICWFIVALDSGFLVCWWCSYVEEAFGGCWIW